MLTETSSELIEISLSDLNEETGIFNGSVVTEEIVSIRIETYSMKSSWMSLVNLIK